MTTLTSPTHLIMKMNAGETCDAALVRAQSLAAAQHKPVLVYRETSVLFVEYAPVFEVAVDGTHHTIGPDFLRA